MIIKAVMKNEWIRFLTGNTGQAYISPTSPSWASAPGREAAPSGAAFAFSGMLLHAGGCSE
jgi:hypothetical protein